MKTLLFNLFARPAHYLLSKSWGPAIVIIPIVATAWVMASLLLSPLASVPFTIGSSALTVFALRALNGKYKQHLPATERTHAEEAAIVVSILQEYGSLPMDGIEYFAKKKGYQNVSVLNILYTADESADFTINYRTKVVTLSKELGSALKPRDGYTLPLNGNYIEGYYQMSRRLELIREHPELVDAPLDMIDELYDTKNFT